MSFIKKISNQIRSLFAKNKLASKDSDEIGGTSSSTREVMNRIYKNNLWGGKKYDFYSGVGSHSEKIVNPYVEVLKTWLDSFENKLVVCDLGCGDFNVGNQLVPYADNYIGVDIVEDLIQRNKNLFQLENLEFYCIDIVNGDLPQSDCVLIRQVLQHLSNEEVAKVMIRFKTYKFLVVTEHLPYGKFKANVNKPTGKDTRLAQKSGIVLTQPPFNYEPLSARELLRVDYRKGKSQIVTTLYQNF